MIEIDVNHCGVPGSICCFADLDEGWLVDPGPESSHRALLAGLPDDWVPSRILLTHIHFDHAGATGRLLQRWPDTEVWVHERGAPHMIDPSRLVASASRIYGDDFDRLWGEVIPIDESAVKILTGGEEIDGWKVAYTPGHANHHVAYLHPDGTAYTGDVGGVRMGDGPVFPPTPPPDIDRELWLQSIDAVAAWNPERLAITHFGTWSDVADQLQKMREGLNYWSELAHTADDSSFKVAVRAFVDSSSQDPRTKASYEQANPPATLFGGWARYWSKRDSSE